ncbi:MAG: DMT family transporter, partial [Longimicrobiales bacterium]
TGPAALNDARVASARPFLPPALVLAVAVLAISWAGPLVRFTSAPALAIAAWRLTLSTLFICVVLLFRRSAWRGVRITPRELMLAALAGALLALHFWTWTTSLNYTTIASSVVLVSMQPLFVAILAMTVLHERPTRGHWIGIFIAVIGAAIIGWGDFGGGPQVVLGDGLALSGAVFGAGYYVIGRALRQRFDLWLYIGMVYGIAAILLVLVIAVRADVALTGYQPRDWLVFVALAAVPTMIGHTGFNYALRYVPAYLANLVTLGEPVGATLIAWLLVGIHETPGPQFLVGGTLVLVGILFGVSRTNRKSAAPAMGANTGSR